MVGTQIFGSGDDLELFEVVKDIVTGDSVGVATTSGAFTAFSADPSARVLEIQQEFNVPVKIDTWKLRTSQFSKVSAADELTVTKSHTYPDDFGMEDLSPAEYMNLAERIRKSESTAKKYLE